MRGTKTNHQKRQMAYHCWVGTPSNASAFCRTPSVERLDGRSLFPRADHKDGKHTFATGERLPRLRVQNRNVAGRLLRGRGTPAGGSSFACSEQPEGWTPAADEPRANQRLAPAETLFATLTLIGGSSKPVRPGSSPTRTRMVPESNPGSAIQSTKSSQCGDHRRGWVALTRPCHQPCTDRSDAPGKRCCSSTCATCREHESTGDTHGMISEAAVAQQ